MTNIDSILHRIRVGLAGHGRKSKVSVATGLTAAQLAAVSKPSWNPTAETIRKIDAAGAQLFPADWSEPSHQPE